MNKRQAKRLHNRDQVEVRIAPATWIPGMILGESREENGKIILPIHTVWSGFMEVSHTEVR